MLAGRVRVGSIMGAAREDIAPSRRYYAGGGGSVRGFGYQELGPKDPDSNPIGGRSLIEGAVEARYRFGDYGVVGFVDAGQVYESSTPGFDNIRFGVGVGGGSTPISGRCGSMWRHRSSRQPGESRGSRSMSRSGRRSDGRQAAKNLELALWAALPKLLALAIVPGRAAGCSGSTATAATASSCGRSPGSSSRTA